MFAPVRFLIISLVFLYSSVLHAQDSSPNLKPEQMRNQELSLDKQITDKGIVSQNVFYSTLTDAVVVHPFPVNNSLKWSTRVRYLRRRLM